jgi:hypothetical protein
MPTIHHLKNYSAKNSNRGKEKEKHPAGKEINSWPRFSLSVENFI